MHPDVAREQQYFDRARALRDRQRDQSVAADGPATAVDARSADELRRRLAPFPQVDPDGGVAFGRIDADGERFYIGKDAVWDDEGATVVVNWQAPIAAPFYIATPDDPAGLDARRVYRCRDDRILDIDEAIFADVAAAAASGRPPVVSDALLDALGAARSGELRDVVATIQRAQYEVITRPLDQVLIVQGGPGTGKTQVGLHRVSWLLHNHADRLGPGDVLVVGPNPAFLRYVSSVLPSLGDEATVQLPITSLGPRVRIGRTDPPELRRLKGDRRMLRVVVSGLRNRQQVEPGPIELVVAGRDIELDGTRVAARARQLSVRPHNEAYGELRAFLLHEVRAHLGAGGAEEDDAPLGPDARGEAADEVDDYLAMCWPTLTPQSFLVELLSDADQLRAAAAGLLTDDEVDLLSIPADVRVGNWQWSAHDVPLLDAADVLLNGPPPTYGHIVADEAQDLSPMQLESVRRRARTGSMTLLGDLAQGTSPWARNSWEEVALHLRRDRVPTEIVELRTSYRLPAEVHEVAMRLLPSIAPQVTPPTPVRSTGEGILVAHSTDLAGATLTTVRQLLGGTAAGVPTDGGPGSGDEPPARSVGVVVPSRQRARVAAALERAGLPWAPEMRGGAAPIVLLSAEAAKGLEFDSVVLVEPAQVMTESERGLRTVFIAMTRCTQRLALVHDEPLPAELGRIPEAPRPVASTPASPPSPSSPSSTPPRLTRMAGPTPTVRAEPTSPRLSRTAGSPAVRSQPAVPRLRRLTGPTPTVRPEPTSPRLRPSGSTRSTGSSGSAPPVPSGPTSPRIIRRPPAEDTGELTGFGTGAPPSGESPAAPAPTPTSRTRDESPAARHASSPGESRPATPEGSGITGEPSAAESDSRPAEPSPAAERRAGGAADAPAPAERPVTARSLRPAPAERPVTARSLRRAPAEGSGRDPAPARPPAEADAEGRDPSAAPTGPAPSSADTAPASASPTTGGDRAAPAETAVTDEAGGPAASTPEPALSGERAAVSEDAQRGRHGEASTRRWGPALGSAVSGEGPAVSGEVPAVSGEGPAVWAENRAVSGEGPAVSGEGPAVWAENRALSGEGPEVSGEARVLSGERPAVSGERRVLSGEGPALAGEGRAASPSDEWQGSTESAPPPIVGQEAGPDEVRPVAAAPDAAAPLTGSEPPPGPAEPDESLRGAAARGAPPAPFSRPAAGRTDAPPASGAPTPTGDRRRVVIPASGTGDTRRVVIPAPSTDAPAPASASSAPPVPPVPPVPPPPPPAAPPEPPMRPDPGFGAAASAAPPVRPPPTRARGSVPPSGADERLGAAPSVPPDPQAPHPAPPAPRSMPDDRGSAAAPAGMPSGDDGDPRSPAFGSPAADQRRGPPSIPDDRRAAGVSPADEDPRSPAFGGPAAHQPGGRESTDPAPTVPQGMPSVEVDGLAAIASPGSSPSAPAPGTSVPPPEWGVPGHAPASRDWSGADPSWGTPPATPASPAPVAGSVGPWSRVPESQAAAEADASGEVDHAPATRAGTAAGPGSSEVSARPTRAPWARPGAAGSSSPPGQPAEAPAPPRAAVPRAPWARNGTPGPSAGMAPSGEGAGDPSSPAGWTPDAMSPPDDEPEPMSWARSAHPELRWARAQDETPERDPALNRRDPSWSTDPAASPSAATPTAPPSAPPAGSAGPAGPRMPFTASGGTDSSDLGDPEARGDETGPTPVPGEVTGPLGDRDQDEVRPGRWRAAMSGRTDSGRLLAGDRLRPLAGSPSGPHPDSGAGPTGGRVPSRPEATSDEAGAPRRFGDDMGAARGDAAPPRPPPAPQPPAAAGRAVPPEPGILSASAAGPPGAPADAPDEEAPTRRLTQRSADRPPSGAVAQATNDRQAPAHVPSPVAGTAERRPGGPIRRAPFGAVARHDRAPGGSDDDTGIRRDVRDDEVDAAGPFGSDRRPPGGPRPVPRYGADRAAAPAADDEPWRPDRTPADDGGGSRRVAPTATRTMWGEEASSQVHSNPTGDDPTDRRPIEDLPPAWAGTAAEPPSRAVDWRTSIPREFIARTSQQRPGRGEGANGHSHGGDAPGARPATSTSDPAWPWDREGRSYDTDPGRSAEVAGGPGDESPAAASYSDADRGHEPEYGRPGDAPGRDDLAGRLQATGFPAGSPEPGAERYLAGGVAPAGAHDAHEGGAGRAGTGGRDSDDELGRPAGGREQDPDYGAGDMGAASPGGAGDPGAGRAYGAGVGGPAGPGAGREYGARVDRPAGPGAGGDYGSAVGDTGAGGESGAGVGGPAGSGASLEYGAGVGGPAGSSGGHGYDAGVGGPAGPGASREYGAGVGRPGGPGAGGDYGFAVGDPGAGGESHAGVGEPAGPGAGREYGARVDRPAGPGAGRDYGSAVGDPGAGGEYGSDEGDTGAGREYGAGVGGSSEPGAGRDHGAGVGRPGGSETRDRLVGHEERLGRAGGPAGARPAPGAGPDAAVTGPGLGDPGLGGPGLGGPGPSPDAAPGRIAPPRAERANGMARPGAPGGPGASGGAGRPVDPAAVGHAPDRAGAPGGPTDQLGRRPDAPAGRPGVSGRRSEAPGRGEVPARHRMGDATRANGRAERPATGLTPLGRGEPPPGGLVPSGEPPVAGMHAAVTGGPWNELDREIARAVAATLAGKLARYVNPNLLPLVAEELGRNVRPQAPLGPGGTRPADSSEEADDDAGDDGGRPEGPSGRRQGAHFANGPRRADQG